MFNIIAGNTEIEQNLKSIPELDVLHPGVINILSSKI